MQDLWADADCFVWNQKWEHSHSDSAHTSWDEEQDEQDNDTDKSRENLKSDI